MGVRESYRASHKVCGVCREGMKLEGYNLPDFLKIWFYCSQVKKFSVRFGALK
jgi:hypothetical protein